ncbi:MAG: hypothetical protein K0Q72_4117, partial [Armatimonadetes bacterium]|nr:hypothetical protein [Armatimonadota bacterium]
MSSNSYTRHSITEEAARAIVAASIEKATSMGAAFTIAVVDESAVIKAL